MSKILVWFFSLLVFVSSPLKAEIVVLIHGYLGSPESWESSGVNAHLQAAGWQHAGVVFDSDSASSGVSVANCTRRGVGVGACVLVSVGSSVGTSVGSSVGSSVSTTAAAIGVSSESSAGVTSVMAVDVGSRLSRTSSSSPACPSRSASGSWTGSPVGRCRCSWRRTSPPGVSTWPRLRTAPMTAWGGKSSSINCLPSQGQVSLTASCRISAPLYPRFSALITAPRLTKRAIQANPWCCSFPASAPIASCTPGFSINCPGAATTRSVSTRAATATRAGPGGCTPSGRWSTRRIR